MYGLVIGASGTLTSAELVDRLSLETSSVSRMVRKLIEAGELAEGASDTDGRAKPLSLTPKGRHTLQAIDAFACKQVIDALHRLDPAVCRTVLDGVAIYAGALEASRTGTGARDRAKVMIEAGYRPGVIGRVVEMQTRYCAKTVGFGRAFEAKIAAGMAAFAVRLDHPRNGLWTAIRFGVVVGAVAIDGQDLGPDTAHLRWFIVGEGLRGAGIGRSLLSQAVGFCDRRGFSATCLWTFRGLDAARGLYERHGFVLVEEKAGSQWGSEVIEQKFVRTAANRPTAGQ